MTKWKTARSPLQGFRAVSFASVEPSMYTETKRFARHLGEHSNHTPAQQVSRVYAGEPRSACRAEEQDEPGSVRVTAVELMTYQ